MALSSVNTVAVTPSLRAYLLTYLLSMCVCVCVW